MKWSPLISTLTIASLITACAVKEPAPQEATLADLGAARLPVSDENIASKSLEEIHALYKDALSADQQPGSRYQLTRRLAALEMMRGERKLFDGEPADELFSETVRVYQELLAGDLEPQSRDQLLYQLAKAHAMGGQQEESIEALSELSDEHRQSALFVESEFRRAENFFSAGLYTQAADSYQQVVDKGSDTPYYHNALYMVGWSLFKQNHYRRATAAFIATLDALTDAETNSFQHLARGERQLVDDCYRILSVTFSYREGAASIDAIEGGLSAHHYLPDLYDALARLYLSQERFQDSAETYKAFTKAYPQADQTHEFFVRAIDMVEKAGFVEAVLKEKQEYAQQFAVGSEYWLGHSEVVQERITEHLQEFIPQLAAFFHSRAQKIQAALDPAAKVKVPTKKQPQLKQDMLADFSQAANYYQQYIDSFPADKRLPEFHFLLAEARFDSEFFAEAVKHYEIVAYQYPQDQYPQNSQAMEAGYAAILAYSQLIERASEEELFAGAWKQRQIVSELRYSRQFPKDKRVPDIVLHASESLVALKFDWAAIAAAEFLLGLQEQQPTLQLSLEQRRSIWWLIAQASFRLEDYPYAELAYQQAIETLPDNDKRIVEWTDMLAASIYKQGELALASGDARLASDQYLRVVEVAPNSTIRVTAQYDAAEQLLALKEWNRAIELLKDFEQRFPNNKLSSAIPAKLVLAYENTEAWGSAADRIMGIFAKTEKKSEQAELLFLAASYYERDGNKEQAIVHYRQYAHNFPEDFDPRLEAMNKLDTIYQTIDEPQKRRFWLRKIIAADKSAGKSRTERSRFLAASASAVLADDAYRKFTGIKLTLPIKNAFKKKKQAMDEVVKAYTKTNDYGIEAFSTLAVYRLGETYAQLSRDLMASQRPANLDALALEQYELLLEEQAFPFEEKAIDIHEGNAQRSWDGVYDASVKDSFKSLSKLLPGRYRKPEQRVAVHEEIY